MYCYPKEVLFSFAMYYLLLLIRSIPSMYKVRLLEMEDGMDTNPNSDCHTDSDNSTSMITNSPVIALRIAEMKVMFGEEFHLGIILCCYCRDIWSVCQLCVQVGF